MLGIRNPQISWSTGKGISQVVHNPPDNTEPIGAALAIRARTPLIVSAPLNDLGLGQILNTRDPFGNIRNVCSGSNHCDSLQIIVHWNLSENPTRKLE